jgi:hypothetical protein
MRTFVVKHVGTKEQVGTNRLIDHQAETLAEEKERIQDGYELVSERVDGVEVPPLPDGLKHYSLLTFILQNHEQELREWLDENFDLQRRS